LTVAFVTLGCKVNQVDSDSLRRRMEAAGYTCVEPGNRPDVLVVNSCAVTAESERKTRQKLRYFRAMYRDCILVLTGCAAQISAEAQVGRPEDYPEADLVMGHRDMDALVSCINALSCSKVHLLSSGESPVDLSRKSIDRTRAHNARTRAHLKIEDGCDQFCAYCIIPRARGPVRSMPLEDVRREIQILDAKGFREIVLVGINLAAYGSDLGCDLGEVLAIFSKIEITNVRRVRLGSLEPDLLTLQLISKLEETLHYSKIELCPHFHVSLQSGCDSVLKRMNRLYSAKEYFITVKRLHTIFPSAAVTTDIMVGFPGESEAEFEASLAFAREVGFAKMHVFPYSSRPGTAASAMPGQVPRAVKQVRAKKMLAHAEECHAIFLNSQIGNTLEVLPEEPYPAGGMRGYSAHYAPVRIANAGPETQNQIIPVKIASVEDGYCVGVLSR